MGLENWSEGIWKRWEQQQSAFRIFLDLGLRRWRYEVESVVSVGVYGRCKTALTGSHDAEYQDCLTATLVSFKQTA
jgi:hypothetical protein